MAINRNVSLAMDMNRIFDFKNEASASEVADFIQPVKEIQPKLNIVKTNNRIITGSVTIYTTPADKDFYLTNITFSLIKDVACDQATANVPINVVIDGVTVGLCGIACLTLTAQQQTIVLNFPIPLKLDRNSTITSGATYTVGLMARSVHLIGYTQETTKGV